jgi:hypothetical protein
VIPWILENSNYVKSSSQRLDAHKTVFVGALHGMLTAAGLAKIMDDLFHGVIYAGDYCRLQSPTSTSWNLISLSYFCIIFLK